MMDKIQKNLIKLGYMNPEFSIIDDTVQLHCAYQESLCTTLNEHGYKCNIPVGYDGIILQDTPDKLLCVLEELC